MDGENVMHANFNKKKLNRFKKSFEFSKKAY